MQRHDAPFCTLRRIFSVTASLILVAAAIALFLAPPPVSRWLALLPLAILVACILSTVRGSREVHRGIGIIPELRVTPPSAP